MKKILITLAVIFILMPVVANADDRFKAGAWELAIGSSSSDLSITPIIGYFFHDNFEGIVHFDYNKTNLDYPSDLYDDTETTSMMFSAGLAYNIPTNTNIVQFVTGEIVYYSTEEDVKDSTTLDTIVDAVGIDAGFGLRFLIGNRASINASIDFGVLDIDADDTNVDMNSYNLGISYSLFLR